MTLAGLDLRGSRLVRLRCSRMPKASATSSPTGTARPAGRLWGAARSVSVPA